MDTQLIHTICSRSVAFALFGLECEEMDITRIAKILSMEWHLYGHHGQPSESEMDKFLGRSPDLRNCDRRIAMQAEQLFRLYVSTFLEVTNVPNPNVELLIIDPFGYENCNSDEPELTI